MTRRITAIVLAAALLGCRDLPSTPGAGRASAAKTSREIVDAAHGGIAHFYFLPPVVRAPSYSGTFDASLAPTVVICMLSGGACTGAPVATYTTTTGPGNETIRIDAVAENYVVNWDTGLYPLDMSATYRIQIKVLATELGHADVVLVNNGSAAKNIATGDAITLVDGRTLPIKFRIEKGAVYVITPPQPGEPPATVTSVDGAVTMQFPAGALTDPIALTINSTSVPSGVPSADLAGTVYEFGPDGTKFGAPVNVTMTYDPRQLPAGKEEQSLRAVTLADSRWHPVPGSMVDVGRHVVTATVQHFSTYAISSMHRLALTIWNPESVSPDKHEIWLAYEDGSAMTKLVDGTRPSWSPDGARLAFVMPYGTCTLGAFDPDGPCGLGGPIGILSLSDPTAVTMLPQTEGAGKSGDPMAWSPDGTKIAYDVDCVNYVTNTDGQSVPVYQFQWACGLDWSSDGSHLLITGWGPGGPPTVVYDVPADGSGLATIAHGLPSGAADMWFAPGTSDGSSLIIGYLPGGSTWEDGVPVQVGSSRPGHWAPWAIARYGTATDQAVPLLTGLRYLDADVNIPWSGGSPGNTDGRTEFDFWPWVYMTPDRTRLYFYAAQGDGITTPGIWTIELDGSHLTLVIDADAATAAAGLPAGSYIQSIVSWRS